MDPEFDHELAILPEEFSSMNNRVLQILILETLESFMFDNPINTRQKRENSLIKKN